MITYDHDTLRLFGIPLFTLIVGVVFVAALAGLFFGIPRWRQPRGKIAVIASAFILLLFAVVISFALVTIESGSMG
jgi:hypothetical protein